MLAQFIRRVSEMGVECSGKDKGSGEGAGHDWGRVVNGDSVVDVSGCSKVGSEMPETPRISCFM
jgi:hypothetical protein